MKLYLPYTNSSDTCRPVQDIGCINLVVGNYPSSYNLVFQEENRYNHIGKGNTLNITIGFNSDSIEVLDVVGESTTFTKIESTDIYQSIIYSALATELLWNKPSSGQKSLEIKYHGSTSYANFSITSFNYDEGWSEWQNQTSCINGNIIQNRNRIQYDSNYASCYTITYLSSDLWNNGESKNYWESRSQSCPPPCTPNLTNTSFSPWTNLGICKINDIQNQSRFRVQYDNNSCPNYNIQNQTVYEYNLTSCNYCSQSITNPQYTEWSQCVNNEINRTKYYLDYNYASCCALTNLESDCLIRTFAYQNITETKSCTLDSKPPRISRVAPLSNKFTNGSDFYIKYTEDNCKSVEVLINGQQLNDRNSSCNSGRNVEKFINLDLSDYNGQTIDYTFIVTDIAENEDSKTIKKVNVDTAIPKINSFETWISGRYRYFNISITETNLDEVTYSYYDSRGKLRDGRLCSRLRDGKCIAKITLSKNVIKVKVIDKAGNYVKRII